MSDVRSLCEARGRTRSSPLQKTEGLTRALDGAKDQGLLSSPILDVLRNALQTGLTLRRRRMAARGLRIVQGEKAAA
jgi:hypothetical protein